MNSKTGSGPQKDKETEPPRPRAFFFRAGLITPILLAAALAVPFGLLAPHSAQHLSALPAIWINFFIKGPIALLVAPMIVGGIIGEKKVNKAKSREVFGRIGMSLLYFALVTAVAALIGLAAAQIFKPGIGVELNRSAAPSATNQAADVTATRLLEHLFEPLLPALVAGNLLPVVFFSVLFALAMTGVDEPDRQIISHACGALKKGMLRYYAMVMLAAPVAVFGALSSAVAHSGLGIFASLGKFVLSVYAGSGFFCLAVLLPIALVSGIPLRIYFSVVRGPGILSYTTATSEAAMPLLIKNLKRYIPDDDLIGLSLSLSYAFDLAGTMIFLQIASLFLAQAGAVTLSGSQIFMLTLTQWLMSKGVAGVPRASFAILAVTASLFGLPSEGVSYLLSVDFACDAARSGINCMAHGLWALVLARLEGKMSRPNSG